MSNLPRSRARSARRRVLAVTTATVLLAACSGGADDPADDTAETTADFDDDLPTDPAVTDAEPREDVPGVTGAAPSDDVVTSADAAEDVPVTGGEPSRLPPLLDIVDGWPETTVVLDDDTEFDVKVADEPDRRQQGLMNVPELPDGVGMLFLFEEPRQSGGFWMKNTLVPLDIAYILDGEVVSVMQMDPCEADPCPSYDPETAYDAALEVSQGALAEAGIDEGATVTWTPPVEVAAS